MLVACVLMCVAGCGGGSSKPAATSSGLTVSCTPSILVPYTTAQCKATAQSGAAANVNWSANGGSINATGVFTAPASTGTVTVSATNAQNSSENGSVSLTIQLKTPASKHVVVVMEENQDYTTVVGNTVGWPNLNALMAKGAYATNYYADVHPSIGNYFMLTTGQIVTTDDSSVTVFDVDNIARRMLAAGISFKVYAEDITQGYLGGNVAGYVIRHNPFAMLSDVAGSSTVANQVICPFSQFAVDLASGTLPEFSFIVPNIYDDAHSASQQQADSWLQTNVVGPLAGKPAFQAGGDGVLTVVFDEGLDTDTANGGGHVAPVFWGPLAAAGYVQKSPTLYQHENMLRTWMDLLSLPNPPGKAANATPMAEFFVQQ